MTTSNPIAPRKIRGVYLRGNTYWLAHQANGRRIFVSLRTSDYAAAVQAAHRIITTPALNPTSGLLGDIHTFLDHRQTVGSYTKFSLRAKRSSLLLFAAFAQHLPAQEISPETIRAWHRSLLEKVRPTTANTYLDTVQAFFRWCVATNRCQSNPCRQVARHRAACRQVRFCTPDERDRIISSAPTEEMRFVYYAGFHAGLRKLEIIEARPAWFNLAVGTCTVGTTETFAPKNRKQRTIPLTAEFKAFLASYGLRDPFLLHPEIASDPERTYRLYYDKRMRTHLKNLGLPWVTNHVMRHTFASILASRGCSIYKIARWLGDTLSVTQDHYAKLLPTDSDIELLTR